MVKTCVNVLLNPNVERQTMVLCILTLTAQPENVNLKGHRGVRLHKGDKKDSLYSSVAMDTPGVNSQTVSSHNVHRHHNHIDLIMHLIHTWGQIYKGHFLFF